MNYFSTFGAAQDWADNYGLRCRYSIKPAKNGLFVVVFHYRGPREV